MQAALVGFAEDVQDALLALNDVPNFQLQVKKGEGVSWIPQRQSLRMCSRPQRFERITGFHLSITSEVLTFSVRFLGRHKCLELKEYRERGGQVPRWFRAGNIPKL
jgi:hypothetical protein